MACRKGQAQLRLSSTDFSLFYHQCAAKSSPTQKILKKDGFKREGLLAKKGFAPPHGSPRTPSRNLKKGGAVAGMLGALFPPTSATGHLAAAHFRGRHLTSRPGSSPDFPLREQIGMKNRRISTRKPYTLRRGRNFGLRPRCPSNPPKMPLKSAQDAPQPNFPLRVQVGMKNCRTSAREAYTIR